MSATNRLAVTKTVHGEPLRGLPDRFRPDHAGDDRRLGHAGGGAQCRAPHGGRRHLCDGHGSGVTGRHPDGKYTVLNTVTRIVPDALIEWNVGSAEHGPYGHVYGWEITAVRPDETEVTNYCDWTDIPEEARDHFPIVPRAMMEKSVENLVALLAH